MATYLHKAQELLKSFSSFIIRQISRSQNAEANALAQLVSARYSEQLKFIPVEILNSSSIQIGEPQTVNYIATRDNWMTLVVRYLRDGVLPEDKKKTRLLCLKAARYMLYDD